MALRTALLVSFIVLLTAAAYPWADGQGQSADDSETAALARAEEAAQALGGDLMRHLLAEMKSGGAAAAVRVCSEVAQDLAAKHSVDGLTVRRVSLKPRNPADAPDPFERAQLIELEELHRQGRLPSRVVETVETDAGAQLRYMRPIAVASACLRCHGPAEAIDPEVRRILAERYPDDRATGYASGDLRGAISVTVPLD